jgi:putative sigma-54 modulation protein
MGPPVGGYSRSRFQFKDTKVSDAKRMKLILTTHNVTLTKAIEDHLVVRLEKLDHLDQRAVDARVTLEQDHRRLPEKKFTCSVRLAMPGPDLFAEDAETDLYAAIDLVVKKLEQQLRKRHNKRKARKHTLAARHKQHRQEATI